MVASQMLAMLAKGVLLLAGLLASYGVVFSVDFTHTITAGSILIAFVIAIAAGAATIRSKIAAVWREEAEGQRAAKERLEETLLKERADRIRFDREQQDLRHGLKSDVAALTAQLKAMEARTDLTVALETIREMNAKLAEEVGGSIIQVLKELAHVSEDRDSAFNQLLIEIRDKLPNATFDTPKGDAK